MFPAVIVEQVPAADLMQVYSGLEADEVTNGIMADATLDVVEEPIMGGDVGLSGEQQSGSVPCESQSMNQSPKQQQPVCDVGCCEAVNAKMNV